MGKFDVTATLTFDEQWEIISSLKARKQEIEDNTKKIEGYLKTDPKGEGVWKQAIESNKVALARVETIINKVKGKND